MSRPGHHAGAASKATLLRANDREALRRCLIDAVRQAGLSVAGEPKALLLMPFSPSAAPDSVVVHDLIDLLFDIGWSSVSVAGRLAQRDVDSGRCDVLSLASGIGLGGLTGAGRQYDVLDLADDLTDAPVPKASVLAGHLVSSGWAFAGLRIVLTRSVPDLVDGYLGCLETLLAAAPAIPGAEPATVAADLLTYLPPDFAIVDVTTSSPVAAGELASGSMLTGAVVLSDDPLLADVVTARLRSTNPATSRLVEASLRAPGLPAEYVIEGDQTPLSGWRGASPVLSDALRGLSAAAPAIERVVESLLGGSGTDADAVLKWLRRTLLPALDPAGPVGAVPLAGVAYGLAGWARWLDGWRTILAKDDIERVEMSLGFDPDRYSEADFVGIVSYLASFEPLIEAASVVDDKMKWCQHGRAVLFEVERVIAAPFDDFVERVDISRGISLMADYLGGRVVPVGRDDLGRVVYQAERNVYLPQPNYLALWGGLPIDVCKIEKVEYTRRARRLLWRTVLSPNGSATHDDGSLTFADEGDGRTRLNVRGRQLFSLPTFWEAVDIDRFPEIKAPLVTDAYRRFFNATFDNIEACYEGRDFRIGRPAAGPGPLPTATLAALLEMAREWLAEVPLAERIGDRFTHARPQPAAVDADGFRHFVGQPSAVTHHPEKGLNSEDGLAAMVRKAATDYATAVGMDLSRPAMR